MIKKYSILLILALSASLSGMHQPEDFFSPTTKKKRKSNNKAFLAFLDQNVKEGLYQKERNKNNDVYYATKPTERNVKIETIIEAYQTIQGVKRISLAHSDIPAANQIASVKYSISNTTCTISVIQTEPEFQRQGFGSLLLTDLEQELRESGCKKISLISVDSAQEFYDKHGFVTENAFGRMCKKLD